MNVEIGISTQQEELVSFIWSVVVPFGILVNTYGQFGAVISDNRISVWKGSV